MNSAPRLLVASLLLLAVPAAGQDQATTLLASLRAADVVVQARVTAATDPSPDWHRLQFTTEAVVKGEAPATFAVLEPAGACCGRSLFALQVGDVRLLFLRRNGALWHPFGGARGVVPADAGLLAHVQALQAAASPAALTALLTASLSHQEPRIADDAAHALATLPTLALDGNGRATVAAALQQALATGHTRSAALVDVAVRCAEPTMLDVLLGSYLDADREDHARLLRAGLRRCHGPTVTARLPQLLDGPTRGLRAAQLLVELPSLEGRTALTAVLHQASHPRVQLCIAEGLLAAGLHGHELQGQVPPAVLELALRRHQQPPRFRAITPNRR